MKLKKVDWLTYKCGHCGSVFSHKEMHDDNLCNDCFDLCEKAFGKNGCKIYENKMKSMLEKM